MQEDCKSFFGSKRECTPKEVIQEFQKRDKTGNSLVGWYGKYHGYFEATGKDGKLSYTDFLLGFDVTLLSRSLQLDKLLIGPMAEEPLSMTYKMSNGSNIKIF
ncbi:hypothetical protein [Roseibium sp.]|uniref:hypothetical protein n=1 Tax=Roseibium sp. TaxID=1936156 RepID=UPI003B502641